MEKLTKSKKPSDCKPEKKFCIDAKLEEFIRHNVKIAQQLVAAFIKGDITTILQDITDQTSLTIPDQTGLIPYAGVTVTGIANILQAFQTFAAYVTIISGTIVDTYINKNGKSIIITADVSQINKLAPDSTTTQVFNLRLYFTFTFDKCGNVTSILIDFNSGPIVLFYNQ